LISAWRRLRHAPGFAIAAIVTLAIAVGANTAILSVADAVLFRPLPYQDADRVFVIQMMQRSTGRQFTRVDYADLRLIDERHTGLSATELLGAGPAVRISTPDGVRSVSTIAATPSYFSLLGVRPVRGRLFTEHDANGSGRPVLLSYSSWRQRFGGDESIVGRTITLGTSTFDVVGVLPADFIFPVGAAYAGKPELIGVLPRPAATATGGTFQPIVRLASGVTREQAQAELDVLAADATRGDPKRAGSMPYLNDVRSRLYPTGRPVMQFMIAAAGLVFLLGCANLANMLMARSRSRERETAVRTALGADRLRVVRPLVFEALLIGATGAAVAVGVTAFIFEALMEHVPPIVYGNAPVGVDARVTVIGLALGVLGALVFAAVPAWRTLRLDVQAIIQNRHRRRGASSHRTGRPMVVVQVALAVMLVFGAVVAARAFVSILRLPLGFEPDNVITLLFMPPQGTKDPQSFYVDAVERIRQRPDVVAVGAAGTIPFDGAAFDEGVRMPGPPEVSAGIAHVLPGYFETLEIPLRRGRLLHWDDIRSHPAAAVLSETAARVLFPNVEPLGQVFDNGRGRTLHVVGVVADVRKSIGEREDEPAVYAIPGAVARRLILVVKLRTRNEATVAEIRRTVATLNPSTGISTAWWTDSIRNVTSFRNPRFQTVVLSSFAIIALTLTAVGVFGVVAFLVVARNREMGIRVAIGANPQSLVRLMVRQALVPVGLGLTIGLLATRWLAQFAESQLYQVETNDPVTLAGAAVTVLAAAITAAYVPARRASRVDPVLVLRTE
jgi:predicted permease